MHLADWKNAGRYFDYNGFRVFYRDEGNGETLVCIHGFPTASWDWHRVWPHLIQRFRVIAADMIGFGFSDKPRGYPYSIHDQAALHERLLASLGAQRIHILAHDYGDTVAQELLARHQDRQRENAGGIEIKSVCLLNGAIFPETHRPLLIQKLLLSPLGFLLWRFVSEKRFRRSFSSIFGRGTRPSPSELAEFWSLITFNDGVRVSHRTIRYMKERQTYRARWTGILQHTHVPLRFVNGTADPVSGAHVVARYRELIPNPDVVALENTGHYPQLEHPLAVVRAFFQFLERPQE